MKWVLSGTDKIHFNMWILFGKKRNFVWRQNTKAGQDSRSFFLVIPLFVPFNVPSGKAHCHFPSALKLMPRFHFYQQTNIVHVAMCYKIHTPARAMSLERPFNESTKRNGIVWFIFYNTGNVKVIGEECCVVEKYIEGNGSKQCSLTVKKCSN